MTDADRDDAPRETSSPYAASDGTDPYRTPSTPRTAMSPADEKLWATLVHLGGAVLGFFGAFLLGTLPSVVGFAVLKDRGPFIRDHTRTALNFQLTMAIAEVVGWILSIVLVGLLLVAAVWVVRIVFSIVAAVKANAGEPYVYPLSFRFFR